MVWSGKLSSLNQIKKSKMSRLTGVKCHMSKFVWKTLYTNAIGFYV